MTVKYEKIGNIIDTNTESVYSIPHSFKVSDTIDVVPFLAGETLSYVKI